MNKFVLYIIISLIYMGLSKSFSPSEFGINYIKNEEELSKIIQGSPLETILVDAHSTGFLLKTYYHKYRIVYGFQTIEEIIVKVSSQYNKKHLNNLGLSILRRSDKDGTPEDYTPLPPGIIFLDDKSLGQWIDVESEQKVWSFYRPYKNLPNYLGWMGFQPTYQFYQMALRQQGLKKVFYGEQNEFGPKGEITKQNFSQYFERINANPINIAKYFNSFFKNNFQVIRGTND